MKKFKTQGFRFMILLFAISIFGVLIGSGAAMAVSFYEQITPGWNFIDGTQDDSPHWCYDVDCWEWVKSDKTRVDFDSIRYYNGEGASDPYEPYFEETLVYDGNYNDVNAYYTFDSWYIEGIDRTCDPTDWVMDTMSSSNPMVLVQQYISYGPSRTSDYVGTWIEY